MRIKICDKNTRKNKSASHAAAFLYTKRSAEKESMLAYSPYCHIGIFRYAKFISDDRKSAYLFLPQANLIHNSIQSYQKYSTKKLPSGSFTI